MKTDKKFQKSLTGNTINFEPKRDGYNFIGWSSASGSKTADDRYANGKTYTGNVPLELYAVYESTQTVTINYNDTIGLLATSTAKVQEDANGKKYITLPTIDDYEENMEIKYNNWANGVDEYGLVYFNKQGLESKYGIYEWSYNGKRYLLGPNIENNKIYTDASEINLFAVHYKIRYDYGGDYAEEEDVPITIEIKNNNELEISYNATLRSEYGYKWIQYKNGDKIKYKSGEKIEGINDLNCDINNIINLKREPLEATIKYYVGKSFDECMQVSEQEVGVTTEQIWKYEKNNNDKRWPTTDGAAYWKDKNGVIYNFNNTIGNSMGNDVGNHTINEGETLHLLLYSTSNQPHYNINASYNETVNFSTTLNANMIMSAMNKSVKAILNESREKIKQNSK